MTEENTSETKDAKIRGVATLFNKAELKSSLNIMRQIPFLAGLLFLMTGAIIFPKLNVFFEFLGRAGGAVISHTLIGLLILLGIGTFFGLVWLIMKYRLQKLSMQYQYKRDIVAQLGLIITDDNRLINTEGRVVTFDDSKNITPIEANPSKTLMLSKRKSYDAYDCGDP